MRPARRDDARRLFAWRNDALTRAMSRNPAPIAWDSHVDWLEASLADPRRDLLIVEREADGVAVGTVRFDRGEETEFSFTVAPEFRCRGLTLKLIVLALAEVDECVGYVKRENVMCQRLIAVAGMKLVEDGAIQTWRFARDASSMPFGAAQQKQEAPLDQ